METRGRGCIGILRHVVSALECGLIVLMRSPLVDFLYLDSHTTACSAYQEGNWNVKIKESQQVLNRHNSSIMSRKIRTAQSVSFDTPASEQPYLHNRWHPEGMNRPEQRHC